jgi:hypothetical protein
MHALWSRVLPDSVIFFVSLHLGLALGSGTFQRRTAICLICVGTMIRIFEEALP